MPHDLLATANRIRFISAENPQCRSPRGLTDSDAALLDQALSQLGHVRIGEDSPLNWRKMRTVQLPEFSQRGSGLIRQDIDRPSQQLSVILEFLNGLV